MPAKAVTYEITVPADYAASIEKASGAGVDALIKDFLGNVIDGQIRKDLEDQLKALKPVDRQAIEIELQK